MPSNLSASGVQERTESIPSDSAPRPAAVREADFSLLDIFLALGSYKRMILRGTVFCAAAATLLAFVLPKRYTAQITLLPPQRDSSMAMALGSQLGAVGSLAALSGGLGLKNPNDIYVGMLKSRTVEDAMIHRFDLMKEYHSRFLSDARKVFEARVSIDATSSDGLIHIAVTDSDPHRAAALANGYVQQFRDLSEHIAISEASQRRLFFEQQMAQAKDKLADAEDALKQTEQKTGLIQLDAQARALIESAASLRAQIAAKEVQIQSLRTFATGENSQLLQAEQELDGLRAQLAKLGGSDQDPSLIVPKGRVPEAGLEYLRKLRDVKYYETIFEILARQFEMAKLDEARQGALIQVLDPAIPPDRRSSPKRLVIILIGTVLGFLAAATLAVWRFSLRRNGTESAFLRKLGLLRRAFVPGKA